MGIDPAVDSPPDRYLDEEEWEVEDHLNRARTGERPLNPEYIEYRDEVLRRAGLDEEADKLKGDAGDAEPESVAEYFDAIRRRKA